MRRFLLVSATMLALVTVLSPAFGATLLFEEFSAATIVRDGSLPSLTPGTNLISTSTTDDHLGVWQGFRWSIQSTSGDYFAQQNEPQSSDQTNLMWYAFSGAGIASGAALTLDFDYQIADRSGTAFVAGLNYGINNLDPFAGWFNLSSNPAEWDPDDGVVIDKLTLLADFGVDDGWQNKHYAFTLTTAYDVLVVGFVMGGSTGFRAVDSVNFQSVPEASAILLLGSGLIGLVGYRRMKRMM